MASTLSHSALSEEGIRFGDDWADVVEPAQVVAKEVGGAQGGLGGSAQHDGDAVVGNEEPEGVENRWQELGWKLLGFVQHDDTANQIVELAAAGGSGREQGFEELDVGGDDQRCVPVFTGEA